MRVGYNKEWKSIWFDEKNFKEKLAEDIHLREYVNNRLPNAGISSLDIHRTSKKITIIINTARPGIVIGKKGQEVDQLKMELQKLTNTNVQINVTEVKRPELDANLVGQNIAQQISKKVSHRKVVKQAMKSALRMGADGIRIQVKGRIGGADMSRVESFNEGRVPLQTIRANIDYASVTSFTSYGNIGIKVWICNGEKTSK
jgi:small subunit ribosomal protein S3